MITLGALIVAPKSESARNSTSCIGAHSWEYMEPVSEEVKRCRRSSLRLALPRALNMPNEPLQNVLARLTALPPVSTISVTPLPTNRMP